MILVLNEKGQVLLGKRKNTFAAGEYGTPSGHMEHGEDFVTTAGRELFEETGLVVSKDALLLFAISNYIIQDWTHQYVTFDFVTTVSSSAELTTESEKCEGWEWHDLDKLPSPLHYPAERSIKQYREYQKNKKLLVS